MIDTKPVVTKEEITLAAYQIWEKAGRPSGRDLECWLEAEKQLLTARTAKAQASGSTKAAPLSVSTPRATTPVKATTSLPKSGKNNARF